MPADQPRTRTVGCKMTDNEYERLGNPGTDGTVFRCVSRVSWRIPDH